MEEENQIRLHVESYFCNLYSKDWRARLRVDGIQFTQLSEEQVNWLERPFSEDEIKGAVWIMEGDKAPGPNRFPLACCEIVKLDLLQVFVDFSERGFLDRGSNVTFILLIPKRNEVHCLADFHLVSLV